MAYKMHSHSGSKLGTQHFIHLYFIYLHCDGWQASRVILFEKLQAHLSLDDFACLDDDQKTAVILDLACEIPSIMKAIMCMWTDRFCV